MREVINTPADAIAQWQEDSGFDDSALDLASLNIPLLHGRYLRYLSDARMKLKTINASKRTLAAMLNDYYLGRLNNPETLVSIGRAPMLQRHLRQDVGDLIAADLAMISLDEKVDLAAEIVAVLEEILKNINSRGYQIKNAIEWRRLTNFAPL